MPLLRAHRRHLGAVAAVLLMLAMGGAFIPDPPNHRRAVELPKDKLSIRAWSTYVADNFGYARSLPLLRGSVQYALGTSSNPKVFVGQRGHLYYNGDRVTAQATGSIYRRDQVRRFADMAEALQRALAPGDRVVVLLPPNAQSVATDDLPAWWHIEGPLEYDLALRELRARGITAVDVKATLAAMPDANELYRRTDTHWRWKAAILAFNMTMDAIGRSEWSPDPESVLAPLAPVPAGDLARLLGLQDYLTDEDYPLRGAEAPPGWTAIDVIRSPPFEGIFDPYAFERAGNSERVLVLGDSFTAGLWRPLLLRSGASRIGWMHHAACGFDFADIVRFNPTYVILAPAERAMPCGAKRWPHGLPYAPAPAALSSSGQ